ARTAGRLRRAPRPRRRQITPSRSALRGSASAPSANTQAAVRPYRPKISGGGGAARSSDGARKTPVLRGRSARSRKLQGSGSSAKFERATGGSGLRSASDSGGGTQALPSLAGRSPVLRIPVASERIQN